jgi:rhodanese-related sulfurtransferase
MKEITPSDLQAIDSPRIIDVREDDEWAEAHVDGTTHVPMSTLTENLDKIPDDSTVYVLCHSGGRSARVTDYLEQQGYDAVNIVGGITAWHQSGLPVVFGDR